MRLPIVKDPSPNIFWKLPQCARKCLHANNRPEGLAATTASTVLTSWGLTTSRFRQVSRYLWKKYKVVKIEQKRVLIIFPNTYCWSSQGSAADPIAFSNNFFSLGTLDWLYWDQQWSHQLTPPYLTPAEYTTSRRFGGTLAPLIAQLLNFVVASFTASLLSHRIAVERISLRRSLKNK